VNDHPAPRTAEVEATATIGQVISDLVRVVERLPVAGEQAGELASILEHLGDEIAEAAAMLRGDPEARPGMARARVSPSPAGGDGGCRRR